MRRRRSGARGAALRCVEQTALMAVEPLSVLAELELRSLSPRLAESLPAQQRRERETALGYGKRSYR